MMIYYLAEMFRQTGSKNARREAHPGTTAVHNEIIKRRMYRGCTPAAGQRVLPAMLRLTRRNPNSSVKKVIGVVSGKGGVGKSMTSALLACAMARRGYHCGILDADITGPSIPKLFGIKPRRGRRQGLYGPSGAGWAST